MYRVSRSYQAPWLKVLIEEATSAGSYAPTGTPCHGPVWAFQEASDRPFWDFACAEFRQGTKGTVAALATAHNSR